jgi:hypothetical protein
MANASYTTSRDVTMEGPRRISERGKKALLEEMMKRNGM